jgi:Flp pilus assembly protein TadG
MKPRNTKPQGQAMVEMALVLPIFLIVLLGIIDFGITLHIWSTLNQQCVQAARAASKRTYQLVGRNVFTATTHAPLANVESAFWYHRSPLMATASYANITFTGVGSNLPRVTVTAEYNTTLYTPLLGSMVGNSGGDGKLKISARAEERKE